MKKPVLQEQLRKILFAFDLDDTLIRTQSNIIVRNGDQVQTLSPAEYAIYEPQPGDEFDFSQFKGLTKPEIIKDTFELFSKVLKSSSKLANAETIILTARTPSITSDLQKFLDSRSLPGVKLYAVGSSDPQKKAEVIQKFIDQGYDTIRFYDDSPKNVAAVKALKSTNPEVDIQAKLIKHIMAEIIRKVNNKKMIKLTDIILNEKEFDVSALAYLDDEIAKELDKVAQQNEDFGATAVTVLALPSILKIIDKTGRIIFKKSGIDLKKKQPNQISKAYNVVLKAAEKIDSYLDVPFNKILSRFVKDTSKRKKAASFLKALTLAIMGIGGSIDVNAATELKNILTDLVPEVSREILQAIGEKSGPKIASIAKNFFNSL